MALTTEKDPSQCSFVFSEKNKKTGYKKSTRRQWSFSAWPFQLAEQQICYYSMCWLHSYLMVPHTDVGADCVVNDAPLAVLSLKRRSDLVTSGHRHGKSIRKHWKWRPASWPSLKCTVCRVNWWWAWSTSTNRTKRPMHSAPARATVIRHTDLDHVMLAGSRQPNMPEL